MTTPARVVILTHESDIMTSYSSELWRVPDNLCLWSLRVSQSYSHAQGALNAAKRHAEKNDIRLSD